MGLGQREPGDGRLGQEGRLSGQREFGSLANNVTSLQSYSSCCARRKVRAGDTAPSFLHKDYI